MSNFPDSPTKTNFDSSPANLTPASTLQNMEHQTQPGMGGGVGGILRRWKRDDLFKRGSLGLRGMALVFSLISFIVMASNKHGDWKNFDKYEEYRYVLAIAILSSLYTGGQVLRQVQEISTGKNFLHPRTALLLDFIGDQIMAYLLISSASSAVPLTNRMREGSDNIFTDTSAAAIGFSFLAFFAVAASSLLSGYKLSIQSYI
ncbi:CASP-like protein 4B1 [Prosopis cineraria]|uniref:CASP-like protein 4B1 n=1 Tax=Prosopis cineraria TaxID=364024 RepID=UPI00240EE154|nr:CASP-like protein 4B1 [Prosopis cineraria]